MSAEADRQYEDLREREYQLRRRIKPKVPASHGSDPWLLASEALDELAEVGNACRSLPDLPARRAAGHLERVCELIRQLAWGPGVPEDIEL